MYSLARRRRRRRGWVRRRRIAAIARRRGQVVRLEVRHEAADVDGRVRRVASAEDGDRLAQARIGDARRAVEQCACRSAPKRRAGDVRPGQSATSSRPSRSGRRRPARRRRARARPVERTDGRGEAAVSVRVVVQLDGEQLLDGAGGAVRAHRGAADGGARDEHVVRVQASRRTRAYCRALGAKPSANSSGARFSSPQTRSASRWCSAERLRSDRPTTKSSSVSGASGRDRRRLARDRSAPIDAARWPSSPSPSATRVRRMSECACVDGFITSPPIERPRRRQGRVKDDGARGDRVTR